MTNTIKVEVAFATPERQLILELNVPEGTTAIEAVRQSGIASEFPVIDLENDAMGIFSSLLNGKDYPPPDEYVLKRHDRIEIYRPLLIDPKVARSTRATGRDLLKKTRIKK